MIILLENSHYDNLSNLKIAKNLQNSLKNAKINVISRRNLFRLFPIMKVNAFFRNGDYMYFNHWTTDLYDLESDTYTYGLNSLGCSTFKFS